MVSTNIFMRVIAVRNEKKPHYRNSTSSYCYKEPLFTKALYLGWNKNKFYRVLVIQCNKSSDILWLDGLIYRDQLMFWRSCLYVYMHDVVEHVTGLSV